MMDQTCHYTATREPCDVEGDIDAVVNRRTSEAELREGAVVAAEVKMAKNGVQDVG